MKYLPTCLHWLNDLILVKNIPKATITKHIFVWRLHLLCSIDFYSKKRWCDRRRRNRTCHWLLLRNMVGLPRRSHSLRAGGTIIVKTFVNILTPSIDCMFWSFTLQDKIHYVVFAPFFTIWILSLFYHNLNFVPFISYPSTLHVKTSSSDLVSELELKWQKFLKNLCKM